MRLRTIDLVPVAAASWLGCNPGTTDVPGAVGQAGAPVPALLATPPLDNFDEAPRTPDTDDPAIWKPSVDGQQPLVIGTLKNAGLQVYDLEGNVVQTISPPNRPAIAANDPPAPGVQPQDATEPCAGSESGETFGRFNNVDISYGFPLLGGDGMVRLTDIAVVTDRGCDVLWVFAIDPTRSDGPLVDVTAADVPRVFPERRVQPSPVQSPGEPVVDEPNPLDDQDTAYGLALFTAPDDEDDDLRVSRGDDDDDCDGDDDRDDDAGDDSGDDDCDAPTVRAVVSQEHRNTIAVLELEPTADGRVSYRARTELQFPATFEVPTADGAGTLTWAACREDAVEDLQFEGLVVDEDNQVLYASQEIIGVWEIDLEGLPEGVIEVAADRLVERVASFGAPFFAVPDGDEFECLAELPPGELPVGTIEGPGTPGLGGANLVADIEGVTVYYAEGDEGTYLIVSSQGSSSFQLYDLTDDDAPLSERHIGGFEVDGVGSTDGLAVSNADLGGEFSEGLLVIQNGDAPPAGPTDPINGFEYDGTSQLVYLRWADVAAGFSPPLEIEP